MPTESPPLDEHPQSFRAATFKTFVAAVFMALLSLCYAAQRTPLLDRAAPDWRPLSVLPPLFSFALVHDFHFWAVHAALHTSRALYRRIHAQHR